jgi:glycerol-3-phosphate acyltransferase PlsY
MREGLLFLIAYTLGSIPFGVVLVHFFGQGDLRQLGSGNIGATNVVRTQGKKSIGAWVFLLDASKGVLACAGAALFLTDSSFLPWIGVAAVCGHCFSVFLKGRGGKGVATALGVFLFLTPSVGFSCLLLWGGVFRSSRISSLSGLVSIGSAPLWLLVLPPPEIHTLSAYISITLIVFLKHRTNIKRLIQGKERKM